MRAATIGLRSVPRVSPLLAAQLLRRQTRVWGKEIFVVWRFFLPTLVFVVWRFFLPTSEIKIAPTLVRKIAKPQRPTTQRVSLTFAATALAPLRRVRLPGGASTQFLLGLFAGIGIFEIRLPPTRASATRKGGSVGAMQRAQMWDAHYGIPS